MFIVFVHGRRLVKPLQNTEKKKKKTFSACLVAFKLASSMPLFQTGKRKSPVAVYCGNASVGLLSRNKGSVLVFSCPLLLTSLAAIVEKSPLSSLSRRQYAKQLTIEGIGVAQNV